MKQDMGVVNMGTWVVAGCSRFVYLSVFNTVAQIAQETVFIVTIDGTSLRACTVCYQVLPISDLLSEKSETKTQVSSA